SALHRGLAIDHPPFFPRDGRKLDPRKCFARKMKEAATEKRGQRLYRYQESLLATGNSQPSLTVGCEHASRHKHVHVRMPLQGARPGMEHGKRSDLASQVV